MLQILSIIKQKGTFMARKIVSGLCLFSFIAFLFNYVAEGCGAISFNLKLFSDIFGVVFLITSIVLGYTNKNEISEKAKTGLIMFIIMCSLVAIIGLTRDLSDLAQGPRTIETNVYECETTKYSYRGIYNYYVRLNNSFQRIHISHADYERLCINGYTIKVTFYEHTRRALAVEILQK